MDTTVIQFLLLPLLFHPDPSSWPSSPTFRIEWGGAASASLYLTLDSDGQLFDLRGHEIDQKNLDILFQSLGGSRLEWVRLLVTIEEPEHTPRNVVEDVLNQLQKAAGERRVVVNLLNREED